MAIVRVRDKAQITLPAKLRKELDIKEGDYLEARVEERTIVLVPQDVTDRFPVIDLSEEEERWVEEGLEDVKQGRVKAFDNVEDLIRDLRDETAED